MKTVFIVGLFLTLLFVSGCALQTADDIAKQQEQNNEEAGKLTAVQFYVPSEEENKISIIDIVSSEVVGEIETRDKPTLVSFTSTMREAIVANQNSSSLSIIDTQRLKETKEIPVGPMPHGIALAPNNDTVYVATVGDSFIDVVSISGGEVISQIDIGTGGNTNYVSLEGNRLYVSDYEKHKVVVIDIQSEEILHEISTGDVPRVVRVVNDVLYVASSHSHELELFSTETGEKLSTITDVPYITDFIINEDATHAFATSMEGNAVYSIDLESGSVVATLENVAGAKHLSFNRQETRIYVTLSESNEVQIIDTETFELVDTIEVGDAPHGIEIKALPGIGGSC